MTYRLNTISIKVPAGLVAEMEKLVLKFIWEFMVIVKIIVKKEKQSCRTDTSFKNYYNATVIKIVIKTGIKTVI